MIKGEEGSVLVGSGDVVRASVLSLYRNSQMRMFSLVNNDPKGVLTAWLVMACLDIS